MSGKRRAAYERPALTIRAQATTSPVPLPLVRLILCRNAPSLAGQHPSRHKVLRVVGRLQVSFSSIPSLVSLSLWAFFGLSSSISRLLSTGVLLSLCGSLSLYRLLHPLVYCRHYPRAPRAPCSSKHDTPPHTRRRVLIPNNQQSIRRQPCRSHPSAYLDRLARIPNHHGLKTTSLVGLCAPRYHLVVYTMPSL